MKGRRGIWVAVAIAVVIAFVIVLTRPKQSQQPAFVPPAVKLATVVRTNFNVHVSVHGRVGPPPGSTSSLAFAVSGRIASFEVHVGEHVVAGQALAQLDATTYALNVAQARGDLQAGSYTTQSDLAAAQAAQKQADLHVAADEAALQREEALYSAGITAAKDVQAARTQLAADRADLASAKVKVATVAANATGPARGQALRAQAALSLAESNLSYATLQAPQGGTVVAIFKHLGETVDPSVPVIALAPELEHSATFRVAAPIAANVRTGDDVLGKLISSGETFEGKVTAAVPAVDPATQTATIVIDGVPADAVSGEAVDASIVVASRLAIVVPTRAIVQDPQTGNTLVFVAKRQQGHLLFDPRIVRVGAGDETLTEISSGLKPGEQVAAQGAYDLLAPAQGSSTD